jgi:hypothetical protein
MNNDPITDLTSSEPRGNNELFQEDDDVEQQIRDEWEPRILRAIAEAIEDELDSYRQQIEDETEEMIRDDFEAQIEAQIEQEIVEREDDDLRGG